MSVDIRLIGYDYEAEEFKAVAIDPDTKAILVKEISPPVTDHGELTGLADDDHTQYLHLNKAGQTLQQSLAVAAGKTIDGVDISVFKSAYDAHIANASAHHTKTDKLSEITIDVNKDWAAKNITNMGTIEHKGATLKSGIQTEGRCSVYERDASTNYPQGDMVFSYVPFREKMTNTPSSITLSDAPETEHGWDQNNATQKITVFGFEFIIESAGTKDTFCVGSIKYLTVGN